MAVTIARHSRLKTAVFWGVVIAALGGLLLWAFWDSLYEFSINPKRPFLTGEPPPAPDYAEPGSWAALPGRMDGADLAQPDAAAEIAVFPAADVFFIHPTTGADNDRWNLNWHYGSARRVDRIVLPNAAAAFAQGARLYAPYYRQATLYTFRSRSEDSRMARRFAFEDVRRAFRHYLTHWNDGRPFFLVGAGQGGLHAAGLLHHEIAGKEAQKRLIAAYIVGAALPVDLFREGPLRAVPPCRSPDATGCVAAWAAFPWGDSARSFNDRAVIWQGEDLKPVGDRPLLCVNPLSWRMDDVPVMQENNRGSLPISEHPGVRLPVPVTGAAGAHCVDGVLRVDRPADGRLRRSPLPGRTNNLLDVTLFYASVRENVRTRQAAFFHDRESRQVFRERQE